MRTSGAETAWIVWVGGLLGGSAGYVATMLGGLAAGLAMLGGIILGAVWMGFVAVTVVRRR